MKFEIRADLMTFKDNSYHKFLEIPVDFDEPVTPGEMDVSARSALLDFLKTKGINGGLDWRYRISFVNSKDEETNVHTDAKKCRVYYRVNIR